MPWCDGLCRHWHPFPLNSEAAMSADGCTMEAELPVGYAPWSTEEVAQYYPPPPHIHPPTPTYTHTHFPSSMPASMYVSLHQAKVSCLLGLHSLDTSTVMTLQVREGQLIGLHAGHKIYLGSCPVCRGVVTVVRELIGILAGCIVSLQHLLVQGGHLQTLSSLNLPHLHA